MTDEMTDDLIADARTAGVSENLISVAQAPEFSREAAEIALGLSAVFRSGDLQAAEKYVAADFVDHEAPEGSPGGPAGYAATANYMRSVFEGATWQPLDFFAAGDRFAVRLTFSGRHVAEFLGIPASGRQVSVQHLHLYRIRGGQVVEHWGGRDDLNLLIQLGVLAPDRAAVAPPTAGAYAPGKADEQSQTA